LEEKWRKELKEEIRKEFEEESFEEDKIIMDDYQKAKNYGIIALEFFIIFIIIIVFGTTLSGLSIKLDDTLGLIFLSITVALYYISIISAIGFTILAVHKYLKYKSNESIKK